ncbi:MAG: NUDIX domain-containing protein [Hyphomicrobiaceae bacterium]
MTPDEIAQLAGLLRKLAGEGLGTPRMPLEVFRAMRGVVAQPVVELLVSHTGRDVLLTPRHDADFQGHHLPGGFVGAGELLEHAVDRIARRELGVSARLVRIAGHYVWEDHPFASPVSLLCHCNLDGEPHDGTLFDVAALPADLIREHRVLIEAFWPPR